MEQLFPAAEITEMEAKDHFTKAFQVVLDEPLDHKNPTGETFKQRVFLSLNSKTKPVVLVTEGYNANRAARRNYITEITKVLDANQLFVEHRYWGTSFPDSTNYDYLTIEQSANDHHRIVELFKPFFTGKWVNTGIGKGGQTTINL